MKSRPSLMAGAGRVNGFWGIAVRGPRNFVGPTLEPGLVFGQGSMSSIKRDVKEKALPRPEVEKI